MFEIALPVLQIAWMGVCTTAFELIIDLVYMIYDACWIGIVGNIFDMCSAIPVLGDITDTIWAVIG